MRHMGSGVSVRRRIIALAVISACAVLMGLPSAAGASGRSGGIAPNAVGMLDCNGLSKSQTRVFAPQVGCTDPRQIEDGKVTRFEDNGHYVGHDEPIVRFLSNKPGSANDVTWVQTLPRDPARLPTVRNPGHDVTHWFELSSAPWFSMSLCDGRSWPHRKCTPNSDANAPTNPPTYTQGGSGSAFMELQFYPPGFSSAISCDNRHWCSALNIDSLECSRNFAWCNPNCTEPVNFALISDNGIPAGPPSPQLANPATFTPNGHTLLMSPGDRIKVHMFDAPLKGGGHAFKVVETDLTTGRSGFMVASARNGFMNTEMHSCEGHPHNFEPEYNRALRGNITAWALLEDNISTQFEIGHFEPCTRVTNPFGSPVAFWQHCKGPYERTDLPDGGNNPETSDAACFPKGNMFGGAPDLVAGCTAGLFQNGDLDYDGTSYYPDWPNSLQPGPFPTPFRQLSPGTKGRSYERMMFETNAPASDVIDCSAPGPGCRVPLPTGPGHFYPYWTQARVGGECVWEFGNMHNGNRFGGDAQYGSSSAYYFATLQSRVMPTTHC
jgi:hypothetical protein